ncbi:cyclase family protein [Candidatus Microgenomates bacterium]|nr:cyclase family protein [Candidatus Microgenomates bacterium]
MMEYSTIIDISVGLHEKTVVYPGTPAFLAEPTVSRATGSRLTKLTMSTHFGTHLDAPLHADAHGKSITDLPLNHFIGTCRVVDGSQAAVNISLSDAQQWEVQKRERILIKTSNSARGLDTFYPDFTYVSPAAANYLASRDIALIGIDYYSIKQKGSTDNTPHTAFLLKNIPIIEGINLKNVEAGEYILVALPLKLHGVDGSPCRAILLK